MVRNMRVRLRSRVRSGLWIMGETVDLGYHWRGGGAAAAADVQGDLEVGGKANWLGCTHRLILGT